MKRIQLLCTVSLAALCGAAQAQEKFPTKNIRMLVPFAAGSQTDILARWIGEKFLESWGQQVVVDNRPSAGGTIASQYVLDANYDGHTMMMVSTGHAGNATLYSKLPYDTIRDFAGVSQVASVPNMLVVAPTLGPKTVKELIAMAKAKPGTMNFSSAGIGSGTQINGEMFKLAAGIVATHVPYKGAPDALNNVIGGGVQFNFAPILVAMGQLKAGRVLALGVSTCADYRGSRAAGIRLRPMVWFAGRREDAAPASQCCEQGSRAHSQCGGNARAHVDAGCDTQAYDTGGV